MDQLEAIGAGGQRHARLVPVLGRQFRHAAGIDIGRLLMIRS